ncbi:MAG: cysteine desulfurase [Candidatus Anstonellales archaeon]
MNKNSFKNLFPLLKNRHIIYFDNAASTQKPLSVINAMTEFMQNHYANVHRGFYELALEATEAYENARKKVAKFINAEEEQIIFTKNATEAINAVAYGLRRKYKKACASIAEHHSNFVPWQRLYRFSTMPIKTNGAIITNVKGNDIYAFHHVSNVTGYINDIKEIVDFIKEQDAISVLDATQSIGHIPIDVRKSDVDFLAFSGHKMLGPTGIGVLYAKEPILEPFIYGGEMVARVEKRKTTFKEAPYRYEAGTPPIIEAIGLAEAINYFIDKEYVGYDKIKNIEYRLNKKMHSMFEEFGIKYIGYNGGIKNRIALFSFNIEGLHNHDIASLFANENIAIRAGHHCAQPLHHFLKLKDGSARASLFFYNDEDEIDVFFEVMEKILRLKNG